LVGQGDDPSVVPVAASLAVVGQTWAIPYRIMLRGATPPTWLATTGASVHDRIDFAQHLPLRLSNGPLILFVREGRLLDAVAGLTTPQQIMEHFRLSVGPLVSLPREEAIHA